MSQDKEASPPERAGMGDGSVTESIPLAGPPAISRAGSEAVPAARRRGLVVVGDTGLFLCAGGVKREHGMSVLYQRYNTGGRSIVMPREVANELASQAKGSDKLGQAAKRATGRSAFFKIEDRTWTDREWSTVEALVIKHEEERAQARGCVAKTTDHDGDIAGILLALESDALFLTNDIPARLAANDLGLRSATFATVLAAEVRDGRLAPFEAVGALEELQRWTYTGITQPSVNTITSQPVVDGV